MAGHSLSLSLSFAVCKVGGKLTSGQLTVQRRAFYGSRLWFPGVSSLRYRTAGMHSSNDEARINRGLWEKSPAGISDEFYLAGRATNTDRPLSTLSPLLSQYEMKPISLARLPLPPLSLFPIATRMWSPLLRWSSHAARNNSFRHKFHERDLRDSRLSVFVIKYRYVCVKEKRWWHSFRRACNWREEWILLVPPRAYFVSKVLR